MNVLIDNVKAIVLMLFGVIFLLVAIYMALITIWEILINLGNKTEYPFGSLIATITFGFLGILTGVLGQKIHQKIELERLQVGKVKEK